MAEKILFQTALTDLETTDVEGIGNLRKDALGKTYKWVKNYCDTSLGRSGPCLSILTSVDGAQGKKVCSPDTSTTYTAAQSIPAGQAMTAIGPSGSATGDHGWILVKGHTRGSVAGTSVAGAVGNMCQGTASIPATPSWSIIGATYTQTLNTVIGARLMGISTVATTTPATITYERSTSIFINCLS